MGYLSQAMSRVISLDLDLPVARMKSTCLGILEDIKADHFRVGLIVG